MNARTKSAVFYGSLGLAIMGFMVAADTIGSTFSWWYYHEPSGLQLLVIPWFALPTLTLALVGLVIARHGRVPQSPFPIAVTSGAIAGLFVTNAIEGTAWQMLGFPVSVCGMALCCGYIAWKSLLRSNTHMESHSP